MGLVMANLRRLRQSLPGDAQVLIVDKEELWKRGV
jgi:hypothetical protein